MADQDRAYKTAVRLKHRPLDRFNESELRNLANAHTEMYEQFVDVVAHVKAEINAYPEELFTEPTQEEYGAANKLMDTMIRKGLGSGMHAHWARMRAKLLLDRIPQRFRNLKR